MNESKTILSTEHKLLNESRLSTNWWVLELAFVLLISSVPLVMKFPYTVNIFLSFEGAYRLYLDQMAFQDFGLPMGPVYWYIPFIFFKLFGASMMSLIKAQVFINIVFLWSIRTIVKSFFKNGTDRLIILFLFALTYTLQNFWPWYNSSTFVYQIVGVVFLMRCLLNESRIIWWNLVLLSVFNVLSFYTKQDTGALAILISFIALTLYGINQKKWWHLVVYVISIGSLLVLLSYPFWEHDFFYWFNLGQEPHTSRVSVKGLLNHLFTKQKLEKFYVVALILLAFVRGKSWMDFFASRRNVILFLTCLYFVLQAIVIDYTSPTSYRNHAYAHGFFWLYVFFVSKDYWVSYKKLLFVSAIVVVSFNPYWNYINRLIPGGKTLDKQDNSKSEVEKAWVLSSLPALKNIRIPKKTQEGIDRLKKMNIFQENQNIKVLNMTELTPLAEELKYEPIKKQPLWYHLGVGIFDKEVNMLANNIENDRYDLVLYQHITDLPDFFPQELRRVLRENYNQVDTFQAPRQQGHGGESYIEVYTKK